MLYAMHSGRLSKDRDTRVLLEAQMAPHAHPTCGAYGQVVVASARICMNHILSLYYLIQTSVNVTLHKGEMMGLELQPAAESHFSSCLQL
jgi:hypothetical protein